MQKIFNRLRKEESGQSLVMVVLLLSVLLGFSALLVDVGLLYAEKAKLQNAADAAALAGAQMLPDTESAESTAIEYVDFNDFTISPDDVDVPYGGDSTKIRVEVESDVPYTFARFLNLAGTSTVVSASATASKEDGVSGLRPWALTDKYKEIKTEKNKEVWTGNWISYTYTYGLEFELKQGGGGGSNGYYGIISFEEQGTDANTYKGNITSGYSGTININDYVNDASGNKNVKKDIEKLLVGNDNYLTATKSSPRVVVIPKIDSTFKVIGFAVIYLKSVDNQGLITANFLYDTTWPSETKEEHDDWAIDAKIKLIE
jgi:hypothetical protein